MSHSKSLEYVNKNLDRILAKTDSFDVMLELTEFSFDVFIEGLKNENPKITEKEIGEKIKEFLVWKQENMWLK